MTQQDPSGGREWRPYEIATPVSRDAAAVMPPTLPPGSPYTPPGAAIADPLHDDGSGVVLADPVARLLAQLIDTAMLLVPILLFVFAGFRQFSRLGSGMEGLSTGAATAIVLGLLMLGGIVIWNIVLLVQESQTVGKRVMKIRIVRSDGTPAGFARIFFMRSLAMSFLTRLASFVHPFLGLALVAGDVLMIFSDQHRCLHDRIADTIVVRA